MVSIQYLIYVMLCLEKKYFMVESKGLKVENNISSMDSKSSISCRRAVKMGAGQTGRERL